MHAFEGNSIEDAVPVSLSLSLLGLLLSALAS